MIATARNLLEAPTVTGIQAMPWAMLAVAVPTIFRAALDGVVVGVAVTPYLPFVLLAALFLSWGYATVVALVSATIADAWFIGPPTKFFEGPTDIVAIVLFLTISAMMIILLREVRRTLAKRPAVGHSKDAPSGIIFSLEDGQAWASWYGSGPAIRLGPQEEVTEMMHDFIAQIELGRRLAVHN